MTYAPQVHLRDPGAPICAIVLVWLCCACSGVAVRAAEHLGVPGDTYSAEPRPTADAVVTVEQAAGPKLVSLMYPVHMSQAPVEQSTEC